MPEALIRGFHELGDHEPLFESKHPMHAWTVRLRYLGRKMSVHYYTSQASHSPEPVLHEVVSCVISDARSGDMSFSEFCSEFGSDEDSHRAEKTWRACKDSLRKLRRFFGSKFDELTALDDDGIKAHCAEGWDE